MTGWLDHGGRPVAVPEPPPSGSHYAAIGDFQGPCYERNAFAQGTGQEVRFLVEALGLEPGMLVLDAGCGTGRHARALAERGIRVVGIDLSLGLLREADLSHPGCWLLADARALPLAAASVDAAICLSQGGFSVDRAGDERVLAELCRVVRPGGRVAVTAYSLAFARRFLAPGDAIDPGRGLVHSRAVVRGPDAEERSYSLWTQCYEPAGLAALAAAAGLMLEELGSGEPGQYALIPPTGDTAEFLGLLRKPWTTSL